jgi:predicted ATPase/Tfp pilus assembly protein PilF
MPQNNLPPQATTFVGREKELVELTTRLADPACRLLTLVGPGGVGKTRLAIHAATQMLNDFSDGVYFVDFQPISSTENIITTIAETIGFSFYGQDGPDVQLSRFLQWKEMLLVLDNFEHLLAGVDLLSELLETAQEIKLLVTSREVLNLREEWAWKVGGMRHPDVVQVEAIEPYSALKLFIERAQRVRKDFSPETEQASMIHICQLVGGMPLGIELAAAWLKSIPCWKIADEIERNMDILATSMRNIPERHRSMRAVCNQSWKLLNEDERVVFKKLSIFRGGFMQEAAEAVAGATLHTLSSLVDKSLLHMSPSGRYKFHALLKQYAKNRLEISVDEKTHVIDMHCAYYTEFMYRVVSTWLRSMPIELFNKLDQEFENVRLAWNHAIEHKKLQEIRKTIEGLWLFYLTKGWYLQGINTFTRAIAVMRIDEPVGERGVILGVLLAVLGDLHSSNGEVEKAREHSQESLLILDSLNTQREKWLPLTSLGLICIGDGELVEAKHLFEEVLTIAREVEDHWLIAMTLRNLGELEFVSENFVESEKYLSESIGICNQIENPWAAAWVLNVRSRIAYDQGLYAEAKQYAQEGLAIAEGFRANTMYALGALADAAYGQGMFEEAKQIYEEGLTIAEEFGIHSIKPDYLIGLANIAHFQGEYPEAKHLYQEALSSAVDIDTSWYLNSFGFANLGWVFYQLGDYAGAYQKYQENLAIAIKDGWRREIANAHNGMGMVSLAMGKDLEAKRHFHAALEAYRSVGVLPIVIKIIVGIAELLAMEEHLVHASNYLASVWNRPLPMRPNAQGRIYCSQNLRSNSLRTNSSRRSSVGRKAI